LTDLIAEQFVPHPQFGIDLGLVTQDVASVIGGGAAPIRLQHGFPGSKGYGYRHVESYPDRIMQYKNLGFANFVEFARHIAQGYTKVLDAKEGRRKLVCPKDGYDLALVVEFKAAQDPFWNIVTGLPYRVARGDIIKEILRADGSEPTSGVTKKRPRFATLSLPKP